MPANRSRTERWKSCLERICERGGGIELTMTPAGDDPSPCLLWRVRLHEVNERRLVVDRPSAAGAPVELVPGTRLVGVMAVGQNRWMFHTEIVRSEENTRGRGGVWVLSPPEAVERCQRRSFYRVSTANLSLPAVLGWRVLDPQSVIVAEVANRAMVNEALEAKRRGQPFDAPECVLPEVGPSFQAKLANISGGGLGLIFGPDEHAGLDTSRLVWLRVNLKPRIPVPVGVTGRIVHTHLDSEQRLYCGVAFEFQYNPSHRAFVINLLAGLVDDMRKAQEFDRRAA